MAARHAGARRTSTGVTLIEQVTTVLILAMLTCMAMPSMGALVRGNRLRTAQSDFMAALQHARETAVMTGKRTLFCPSRDNLHCSAGGHWDEGWLLGHDADRDGQPDQAPLYTGAIRASQLQIRSSVARQLVRFAPDGSAGGSNLTVLFCQPGETRALGVVVANSGRIRGIRASDQQRASCLQER